MVTWTWIPLQGLFQNSILIPYRLYLPVHPGSRRRSPQRTPMLKKLPPGRKKKQKVISAYVWGCGKPVGFSRDARFLLFCAFLVMSREEFIWYRRKCLAVPGLSSSAGEGCCCERTLAFWRDPCFEFEHCFFFSRLARAGDEFSSQYVSYKPGKLGSVFLSLGIISGKGRSFQRCRDTYSRYLLRFSSVAPWC